ncbi:MAG: dockerin type I domain-containing protein, partial [Armatimonadetes bacterium]|nr:dockerin type I domain-containing protein [Armatimonadota bacterium]
LRIEQPLARLYGRVFLQDFLGDVTRVPITLHIRESGSTEPIATYEFTLNSDSQFYLELPPQNNRDVALKASHWLREVIAGVNLQGEVGLYFELVNGDVDGDNEVSLLDFGELVTAFGSVPGDANWNPNADLDGDEEVSLVDFSILVRNFGEVGDE